MGSQLSYEPIFKPPKTAWGRVVYNSRLFKDRMGSQLSYRPIFVFRNENSVTLLEGFVKDFSPGRSAGNVRVNRTRRFLKKKKKKTTDPFVKITVALREKACYNNAETFVHKKSITQSQEDNGYGIY